MAFIQQQRIRPDQVFGVDIGRGYVNVVDAQGNKEQFPSYIREAEKLDFDDSRPDDMIAHYNGVEYWVGEYSRLQDPQSKFMMSSKLNDYTLVMGLVGLFLAGAQGDVYIYTGVPISQFNREAAQIKELFEGEHTITLFGKRRTINIKQCRVLIESGAFIFKLRKRGRVRIIDPGAKTTNFVTLDNGRFVGAESGTLDEGWETSRGGVLGPEKFSRYIAGNLGRQGWTETDPEVYVIGGRAHDLLEPLRQSFQYIRLPEGLEDDTGFANAYGYLEAGIRELKLDV